MPRLEIPRRVFKDSPELYEPCLPRRSRIGVWMSKQDMRNVDFTGTDLTHAHFQGGQFDFAIMRDVNLVPSENMPQLEWASFIGADLSGMVISRDQFLGGLMRAYILGPLARPGWQVPEYYHTRLDGIMLEEDGIIRPFTSEEKNALISDPLYRITGEQRNMVEIAQPESMELILADVLLLEPFKLSPRSYDFSWRINSRHTLLEDISFHSKGITLNIWPTEFDTFPSIPLATKARFAARAIQQSYETAFGRILPLPENILKGECSYFAVTLRLHPSEAPLLSAFFAALQQHHEPSPDQPGRSLSMVGWHQEAPINERVAKMQAEAAAWLQGLSLHENAVSEKRAFRL